MRTRNWCQVKAPQMSGKRVALFVALCVVLCRVEAVPRPEKTASRRRVQSSDCLDFSAINENCPVVQFGELVPRTCDGTALLARCRWKRLIRTRARRLVYTSG